MRQPADPEPEPSESTLKPDAKSLASKFLKAQEERILNNYTVDGERIPSYENDPLVNTDPTDPIVFLNSINYIPVPESRREEIDRLKVLFTGLRQQFLDAKAADVWYDPMDDAASVEKGGISSLSLEDQKFVRAYLMYLRRVTKAKGVHASEIPHDVISEQDASNGRHAIQLVREKGRRALQLNGEGIPQEQ